MKRSKCLRLEKRRSSKLDFKQMNEWVNLEKKRDNFMRSTFRRIDRNVLRKIPSNLTEEEIMNIVRDKLKIEDENLNHWTKEEFVKAGDIAEDMISEKLSTSLKERAEHSLHNMEKYFRPLSEANETPLI